LEWLTSWWLRAGAGLVAISFAGMATAHASAAALPGDPLYGIKQLGEEVELWQAHTDDARATVLLHQADLRLDEITRLVHDGRLTEVRATAQRYDDAVRRAGAALDSAGRDG